MAVSAAMVYVVTFLLFLLLFLHAMVLLLYLLLLFVPDCAAIGTPVHVPVAESPAARHYVPAALSTAVVLLLTCCYVFPLLQFRLFTLLLLL